VRPAQFSPRKSEKPEKAEKPASERISLIRRVRHYFGLDLPHTQAVKLVEAQEAAEQKAADNAKFAAEPPKVEPKSASASSPEDAPAAASAERALPSADRCDVCDAQAYVRVVMLTGELFFCGHHARKHADKLKEVALLFQDETSSLTAGS